MKMVEPLGENPNRTNDFFRDLEDWGTTLESFPEFNKNGISDAPPPEIKLHS